MNSNIAKILANKYESEKLAPVYLFKYDESKIDINQWVIDFKKQFSKSIDHPDFFDIKKGDEKEYKVDNLSIRDFFSFIQFNPIELKTKFIFFFNSESISTIVANKLLKKFEELEDKNTIILLCPKDQNLLPTIESRCVNIFLETNQIFSNQPKNDEYQNALKSCSSPFEYSKLTKKSPELALPVDEEKILIAAKCSDQLSKMTQSKLSYVQCESLLNHLKSYEINSAFNNSLNQRIQVFFD